MKYDCDVIRDLLPLYADKACSEKSRDMVEEHLEECPDCRNMVSMLLDTEIEESLTTEKDSVIDYGLRQFKRRAAVVGSAVSGAITLPVLIVAALILLAGRTVSWVAIPINNTVGGQPVSMENIRQTAELCHRNGVPVVMDSARFAENAYFIKTREAGYKDKTIKEIALEMFSYVDAMTMSAKKDALVNMGGFIATRRDDWFEGAKAFCIPFEGYLTYGGLNGRDLNAMAVGLDENTEFDMLETRIKQVAYLAQRLDEFGIPYQRPAGGHAIFVDASRVLTNVPKEEFPAQTLTCELYLEAGVRACEIGYILADRDPVTRENRFGGLDLLRMAIPRRVYTNNHMDVIAVALKNVFDRRESINHGVRIVWETELMRHFTVKLDRIK